MGSVSQQMLLLPPSSQEWQDPRGKRATEAGQGGRTQGPRATECSQPPPLCSVPSRRRKAEIIPQKRKQTKCDRTQ